MESPKGSVRDSCNLSRQEEFVDFQFFSLHYTRTNPFANPSRRTAAGYSLFLNSWVPPLALCLAAKFF